MSQTTSGLTAWYISRNGAASGPFATDIVLSMLRDGRLEPLDLVFREGETEWRPAISYAELKNKKGAASTPSANTIESLPSLQTGSAAAQTASTGMVNGQRVLSWIVLRPHSSTYLQEGPFETQAIIDGLQTGRFQFSQYAWHVGMHQWMRIGDLREFDRRSRTREARPHVPPPLPDPIEAVLLEDDKDAEAEEFHVTMRGVSKLDLTPNPLESMQALNVTKLGSVSFGGAAAESPEEKSAQERAGRAAGLVVSTSNLAGVPWEQDISESYAESRELIDDEHSGLHPTAQVNNGHDGFVSDEATGVVTIPMDATSATPGFASDFTSSLENTPTPFVPPQPLPMMKDAWEKWGRYVAGAAMAGLGGLFLFHAVTTKAVPFVRPVANVEKRAATAPAAAMTTAAPETNVAAAPPVTIVVAPTEKPVAVAPVPPAISAPADFGVVGLKLDKPDGQIVVQGNLPSDVPIHVNLKGRLGQVLSSMSIRKTVTLKRKAGEIPSVSLKELKLPAGAYTVEVDAGGAKTKNEIFVGTRDAKFLDRLETHLREISFETQAQKKALFYAAKELDILARELGQNYGQLRGKKEQWTTFYAKWNKRVDSISRSLADVRSKKIDDQAFPEETTSLLQALTSMNELGSQYEQAIGQQRDVASDALTELIAELARQKDAIGNSTARPVADTPDGML